MRSKAAACMLFGMLWSFAAWAEERIALYFNDRPPYLIPAADGSVSGLTATPAANAFKAAGIAFTWIKTPTARMLLNIRQNVEPACAVGWFRNRERELFAKYTKAIYRDGRTVALAHKTFPTEDGARLEDVLAQRSTRVLLKNMFSYGPQIDAMLARYRPPMVHTTDENVSMVKALLSRQADFMFVAEEEAHFLLESAGSASGQLRIVMFSDITNGEERHIMCSRQVPDDVITRLNRAIN